MGAHAYLLKYILNPLRKKKVKMQHSSVLVMWTLGFMLAFKDQNILKLFLIILSQYLHFVLLIIRFFF